MTKHVATGDACDHLKEEEVAYLILGANYLTSLVGIGFSAVSTQFDEMFTFMAVVIENLRANEADWKATAAFAAAGAVPPDHVRQPVRIVDLAKVLDIPFETARRRVQHLQDAGLCASSRRGVYVPRTIILRPDLLQAVLKVADVAQDICAEARRLSLHSAPPKSADDDIRRHVTRMAAYFAFEAMRMMRAKTGLDHVSILILLCVATHSPRVSDAGTVSSDQELRSVVDAMIHLRKPRSIYGVSKAIGVPQETVRRKVHQMIDDGLLESQDPHGLVVKPQVWARPEYLAGARELASMTHYHLGRLFELGVCSM